MSCLNCLSFCSTVISGFGEAEGLKDLGSVVKERADGIFDWLEEICSPKPTYSSRCEISFVSGGSGVFDSVSFAQGAKSLVFSVLLAILEGGFCSFSGFAFCEDFSEIAGSIWRVVSKLVFGLFSTD